MAVSPEASALKEAPVHGFRGDAPDDGPAARPRGLTVAVSREAGARATEQANKGVAEIGDLPTQASDRFAEFRKHFDEYLAL